MRGGERACVLDMGAQIRKLFKLAERMACPALVGQSSCPTEAADGSKVMPNAVSFSAATLHGLRFVR